MDVDSIEAEVDALRCRWLAPGIVWISTLVESGRHDHAIAQAELDVNEFSLLILVDGEELKAEDADQLERLS